MSTPTPPDNLLGKTLGQFAILEEIGRGGMATVYKSRQLSMNRVVAVKVLPPHFLHDPSFYERFEREVAVITELEHPHILPIIDYGQAEGVPYIAMRYLGGGSLEQVIRRGLPPLDQLEKPLRQIAQALDFAHRQGVIHRDLKPGNIMLDEHGNAYLSDFGIARVLGSNLTGSMIVGTPAYMSPEQANGMPIDGRSDIYALGVVLFEMLTGREPYQAETPMAILLKHINEPMPPVSDYRGDVPRPVEDVIAKATAKNPDDRYPSATEMVEALAAALRGVDVRSTEASRPTRSPGVALTSDGAPGVQEVRREASASSMFGVTGAMPQVDAPISATMSGSGAAKPGRPAWLPWAALVALIALIGGGVFVASQIGVAPAPDLDARPTPFPRASTIDADLYTISMPNDWIPAGDYLDQSDAARLVHIWQSGQDAFVVLALVPETMDDADAFEAAVGRYHRDYYAAEIAGGYLTPLDEATAEDGSLRRSYRLGEGGATPANTSNPAFPPGQLDIFYLKRGPYLAVLETYTSDATGNTLVPTLQRVLDSLRVKPSAS
jgi:serine/threonine-protein kinase